MLEKKSHQVVILLTISLMLMSSIMRAPITTMPLMLPQIAESLHVAQSQLGIITTIPLIMFLLISNFATKTMVKFGLNRALMLSLLSIIVGSILRMLVNMPLILLGTALIGIGIAHLNVLMPPFVATYFPNKIGLYTSVYSLAIMVGSAVFSLITAPVVAVSGWQGVMGLLVLVPAITLVLWFWTTKKIVPTANETIPANQTGQPKEHLRVWSNYKAWPFLFVFGVQATVNYTTVAWLPSMMLQHGVPNGVMTIFMSLYSFVGMPLSIILPTVFLTLKAKGTTWVSLGAGMVALLSVVMLFHTQTKSVVFWGIVTILIGASTAFFFLFSLTMFASKTQSPVQTARLSGMAQAGGYFISAFGPILYGHAFDANPAGKIQNIVYLILVLLMIVSAVMIAHTKNVFDE
ncbi:MFS transporter [Weissella paramesenteroides]|nr:MFS transporter [Weissella paramesenteroides]KAA8438830.1 MFS transporter [Weissella paramesenteroides]